MVPSKLDSLIVTVTKSGIIQLRNVFSGVVYSNFGSNMVDAQIRGDTVVGRRKDGKTFIWKISSSGRSVIFQKIYEAKSTLEYHTKLNPKLWIGDELKPVVRLKLLEIAKTWAKFSLIPIRSIQDIIITGGNVNYNYTRYSDIDLHLIVDKTKIDNCPKLLDEYLKDKKQLWALTHDVKIYELPVELYAEDIADVNHSADRGVFSIKRNEWVSRPTHKEVNLKDPLTRKKLTDMIKTIEYLINSRSDDLDSFKKIRNRIKQMRITGIASGGEFGPENLIFKELRNLGYLDKISNHIRHLEDRSLSLEGYEY